MELVAAQTQPCSCSTCASVSSGFSACRRRYVLRDPGGRVRELHRGQVVRVGRRRLVGPQERLCGRHPGDGEAGFALDVIGIERRVEQRAEDRVVPRRGFACGRDRERLRRRAGTTARGQGGIGAAKVRRRPEGELVDDHECRVSSRTAAPGRWSAAGSRPCRPRARSAPSWSRTRSSSASSGLRRT